MAHAQEIRPVRVAGKPQTSLAAIFIVVAFHLVAIAAFVAALRPHIFAMPVPPDLTAVPMNNPPPTQHERHLQPIDLIKPTGSIPIPPTPFDTTQDHDAITGPAATGATNQSATDTDAIVAAHGIPDTHTIPTYPPLAVRLNQQGNVQLKLEIDATGAVVEATILRSSGYYDLDDAAVSWVKAHWRYLPATRNGQPMATSVDAIVTFRLTGRQ